MKVLVAGRRGRARRRAARSSPRLGLHPRPHRRHRGAGRRPQGDALGDIERQSGLTRDDIEEAGRCLHEGGARDRRLRHGHHPAPARRAERAADRQSGAAARQYRPRGAGLCPVRGHSNVQGDRTVGITEDPDGGIPRPAGAAVRLQAADAAHGHNVVTALEAMIEGEVKVFIGMGGNFARRSPTGSRRRTRFRNLDLTVHVSTKLNRSHLDPWPRGADPAVPRPHRDRRPGDRPAIDHRRGFDVHGACLERPQQAGVGASAERAGDRRRHGQGDAWRSAPWSTGKALSATTTSSAMRSRPSSRSSRATTPASACPAAST